MSFAPHIWGQLKNITATELIRVLQKDGWTQDEKQGSDFVFRHSDGRRVSIHFHPSKTYGPKLLKSLLADTGWTEADLRRLKLIK